MPRWSNSRPISGSSRSTPKTTWCPADPRTRSWRGCASATPSRCTGSGCRWAGTTRSMRACWRGTASCSAAMRPTASPSTWPGRATMAAISTTCCPSCTTMRRCAASAPTSTNSSNAWASPSCSKTPPPTCASRPRTSTRRSSCANWSRAPAADCCWTSTTCTSARSTTASTRAPTGKLLAETGRVTACLARGLALAA
ncbi:Uncharacterised protein [Bordetella pertussis]|nr:Uncharacterised protein [Bordetella pertussis]